MATDASTPSFRGLRLGAGEAWAGGSSVSYALTNVLSRVAVAAADPLVAPVFRLLPTLAIAWIQVVRQRAWSRASPTSVNFIVGIALLGYGRSAGSEVLPGALGAIPLAVGTAIGWAVAANCSRYALTHGTDKYLVIALSQTLGILMLIGMLFALGRGVTM